MIIVFLFLFSKEHVLRARVKCLAAISGGSHLPVTLVVGDPTPSCFLLHTHAHECMYIYISKNKFFKMIIIDVILIFFYPRILLNNTYGHIKFYLPLSSLVQFSFGFGQGLTSLEQVCLKLIFLLPQPPKFGIIGI